MRKTLKEIKNDGKKKRKKETGRQGDSTIYGRLVVMVIGKGRDVVVRVMGLHWATNDM